MRAPSVPLRRSISGLVACTLLACSSAAPPPPSAPSPLLSATVPDFRRAALAHGEIDTRQLRGRVVVVKFFAKACEPCRRSLPAAERLHQRSPDVAFIGVGEDETQDETRDVVREHALSFPVVHDQGNVLSARFRVREIPATFVVDTKGVVRWVAPAEQDDDGLARAIEAAK